MCIILWLEIEILDRSVGICEDPNMKSWIFCLGFGRKGKLGFKSVCSSDELMFFDGERLCEKVGFICVTGLPDNFELAVSHSVSDPVVAHSGCLELLDFGSLVCGVVCRSIVGHDGGAYLWVPDVCEDVL